MLIEDPPPRSPNPDCTLCGKRAEYPYVVVLTRIGADSVRICADCRATEGDDDLL